ncbi:MAG TPA: retroviral-like aspartic protease family protein [Dehalococcoidia bacterium]|nr:retroviral-like aspartic protease family protein [Dehalococcoidia bacterium]
MGTFTVPITIGDDEGEQLNALVDTGATNTVIPGDILRRLGVEPHRRSTFQFADGREMELDIGRAWVRVDGQREFTQVVFGPEGTDAILGAITLEEMNLAVDPVAQRLVPVNRYLM